jgi:hypothetical protein
MKNIATLLGAALLCGSFAVQAQTTPPPAGGAERKGPTAEQRQKFRADMKAAHEACKDSKDRRACMTESFCAKQADAAKCRENAKQRHAQHAKRMDQRQEIAEACTGKRGDDLRSCYRGEMDKRGIKPGMHHRGHHGKV